MSKQYPGGIISKTAPVPSGPYSDSTAPGIWTLDQQAAYAKQGQWPTQGNVNPNFFIENLFSTYVYAGTGAAQTITNGINLSTNGGLVWTKNRVSTYNNVLIDTARGSSNFLMSDQTSAQTSNSTFITSFNSNGYTLGTGAGVNASGEKNVGWTFRKQPKFFDIVTYSGTGSAQDIAHNLGSVPGCIIVKNLGALTNWAVYHRSLGGTYITRLNTSGASETGYENWANTDPTSAVFTVGNGNATNGAGYNYIAYLFAHDAGGFGVSGSENVVSCGSYTGNGSATGPSINLGYEAQWVMIKKSSAEESWYIYDNMRGVATLGGGQSDKKLRANSSGVEGSLAGDAIAFNATGFNLETSDNELNNSGSTYIYVAIRRGPMAVPTLGTTVFSPQVQTPDGSGTYVMAASSGFPVDWLPTRQKGVVTDWYQTSRLTNNYMSPNQDYAESSNIYGFDLMQGVSAGWAANSTVSYAFRRAPGFFDVVAYTGTLSNLTVPHNLGVAPEMMIVKCRSSSAPGGIAANWAVYAAPQGNDKFALLNTTDLFGTSAVLWQATTPTASNFYVGAANYVNGSGQTYVAYLFASVAGVSKVGTYTGTGALLTVNCGFTTGARFVLIKRADTSGDWWTYDSARGITSGDDPYLLMNSTAAEVTGTNYVDTDTTGFKVTAAAPAGLNASGGTYIFLAIA
jgi:hypothetical protein